MAATRDRSEGIGCNLDAICPMSIDEFVFITEGEMMLRRQREFNQSGSLFVLLSLKDRGLYTSPRLFDENGQPRLGQWTK